MELSPPLRLIDTYATEHCNLGPLPRTHCPDRQNLYIALQHLGIKGIITYNAEPPSLVRAGMYHRVPALEIEGNFWTCKSSTMSVEACTNLLKKILTTTVSPQRIHSPENTNERT